MKPDVTGWLVVSLVLLSPCNVALMVRASNTDSQPRAVGTRLTLICSANAQGILEPCGCQPGQGGGLARRATALASLRPNRNRAVVLECGNSLRGLAPDRDVFLEMGRLMRKMGYRGGVIGPTELGLGEAVLQEMIALRSDPLVLTNVRGTSGRSIARDSVELPVGPVKLEVFAVADATLVPKDYVCLDPLESLSSLVRISVKRGHLPILVSYQPLAELRPILTAIPGIQLALVNSSEVVDRTPERFGKTWIVPLPSSGRQLHVLDFRVSKKHLEDVQWDVLDISPSILPDATIAAEIGEFYKKRGLDNFARPRVLSAEARAQSAALLNAATRECASCHEAQAHDWSESKHAHAWLTLKQIGAESKPDCVSCHTTPLLVSSFESSSGGVGCPTCHGEGSLHAAQPHMPGLIVRSPQERVCAACHTSETSPNFEYGKFVQLVRH